MAASIPGLHVVLCFPSQRVPELGHKFEANFNKNGKGFPCAICVPCSCVLAFVFLPICFKPFGEYNSSSSGLQMLLSLENDPKNEPYSKPNLLGYFVVQTLYWIPEPLVVTTVEDAD